MSSDSDEDLGIYMGVWTNWSRGPILGATLTLSRFNANLLIAFTSFLLGFVGTRLWRITCLYLHRYYSGPGFDHQNGLHQQRQVILRNSQSAESGVLSLSRLHFAWRHNSEILPRSTLLPIPIAILVSAGVIVAGGFSATISTSMGREVLVDGTGCGILVFMMRDSSSWETKVTQESIRASDSANYAQQCYSSNSSGGLDCTRFVSPTIPTIINDTAGCPFSDDGICRTKSRNLLLESIIDSNEHLGWNVPDEEQIQLRGTFHCAPLTTDGYSSIFEYRGQNYTRYHYGSLRTGPKDNVTVWNHTHQEASIYTQYNTLLQRPRPVNTANLCFAINIANFWTVNGTTRGDSNFEPIPDLRTPDGDLAIFFMAANGVAYLAPTKDPWYQATTPGLLGSSRRANGSRVLYMKDEAASPLACVSRYQFCRPGPSNNSQEQTCGPLGSAFTAKLGAASVFGLAEDTTSPNISENATKLSSNYHWYLTIWETMALAPSYIFHHLGRFALASQRKSVSGLQGPLPDNQWQLDMIHIWHIYLASMQTAFVATARGTNQTNLQAYLRKPANKSQKEMCANQKILSSRAGSFSLFGLCFTYILSFLIIATSFVLEPLFDYYSRRQVKKGEINLEDEKRESSRSKHLEWVTHESLQLHRLAQEALGWGSGTWKDCTDFVPITSKGQPLGCLDVSDPEHPVLCQPKADEITTPEMATTVDETIQDEDNYDETDDAQDTNSVQVEQPGREDETVLAEDENHNPRLPVMTKRFTV